MKQLYVIGNPISHSLSPIMHNAALKELGLEKEYTYQKQKILPNNLEKFVNTIRRKNVYGLSVTLPHKESIIPHLDELSKEAELIQAVNTIYKKDGKLIGHNTDGFGCIRALEEAGVSIKDKKIILLGAGGAARAIAFTLLIKEIKELIILNRTEKRAKELADEIKNKLNKNVVSESLNSLRKLLKDTDILINATSAGMLGETKVFNFVDSDLKFNEIVIMDIVYNPRITSLLKEAEKQGAKTIEGYNMLLYQGAGQFELFTGKKAPIDIMRKKLLEVLK